MSQQIPIVSSDDGSWGTILNQYLKKEHCDNMTVLAVDDALGASGDLYYRNGTGDLVRLSVGTTSQVLTVSSGAPTWATAGRGLSQQQVMAIATMRI